MHIPVRDQCNWLRERIETAEAVRVRPAPGPRMRLSSMRAPSLLAPPRSCACVCAAEGPQWARHAARGAGCGWARARMRMHAPGDAAAQPGVEGGRAWRGAGAASAL